MTSSSNAPTWPYPDQWPAGHYDASPPKLENVTDWIGGVLSVSPSTVQLRHCFAFNSWAITALFDAGNTQVVFKAVLLDLFAKHPLICQLLQKSCPNAVPELLASHTEPGGHWTLFETIAGDSVQKIKNPDLLVQMAETMAQVQINFANLSDERISQLPRFGNNRLIEMLDFLIQRVQDYYLPVWQSAGGARLKRNGKRIVVEIPDNFVMRLENSRPKIEQWANELIAGQWPDSIYHTDFHPGNTIVEPDGNLRIIDWDRAVLSFPFQSIRWLDTIAQGETWQRTETQTPHSLVEVYLDTIPWNSRADRNRAWHLMNLIGGIPDAHESEMLNDALHLKNRMSGNIALLLTNALKRWESAHE